jgi:hypothetical protein
MNEVIQYIAKKFGLPPDKAQMIWDQLVSRAKAQGQDLMKIPPQALMQFIDQLVGQLQGQKGKVDPRMAQQLQSLGK